MCNSFFVCYAREDYEYVASFQVELQNQINEQSKNLRELLKIELKIDQTPGTINLGEKYKDKIENIIENSTGAILFLSKNFSNSQFINEIEIPKILEKKKIDSDYLILPIFIDAAKNINKEILTYQAPNSENNPLKELNGELRKLIIKKFVKDLVDKVNNKKIHTLGWTKFLSLRNLIIVFGLLSIALFGLRNINENNNINEIVFSDSVENEQVEITQENISAIVDQQTTCITNAKTLYTSQWFEQPFVYFQDKDLDKVDCNNYHDGEVFAKFESTLTKQNSGVEVFKEYEKTFTYCFDEFKYLSGYSPFESPYIIEIIVVINQLNSSTLDYYCTALFLDETNGDWIENNQSFLSITKDYLYERYGYYVTSQQFLTVGTCGIHPFTMYGSGSFEEELINNLLTVSCNEPHSFEVLDAFTYLPSEDKSLSFYEDELGDYCNIIYNILYSDFPNYENTYFRYIANPSTLKNKTETIAQCIVIEGDLEYDFWIYKKKTRSVIEEFKKRSYQLEALGVNKDSKVEIVNCPLEPVSAFTEEEIESGEFTTYDFNFQWINLDTSKSSLVKLNFYDAGDYTSYEIDLNKFEENEISLSSWTVNVPIRWEYVVEQENNFGEVVIEYIKDDSIILTESCNFELVNY